MSKAPHLLVRIAKLTESCVFFAVVQPLSLLVSKDPELVAFIPMDSGRLTDNTAHFYELLRGKRRLPKSSYLLLTRERLVSEPWVQGRSDAESYDPYSPASLWKYLRTGTVIVDHRDWSSQNRFACFAGAKKVQLWHGIPLKQIELSHRDAVFRTRSFGTNLVKRVLHTIKGRYPNFDLVVSTSPFFEEHAFRPSFKSKVFENCGYPRNDLFFLPRHEWPKLDVDHDALRLIRAAKADSKRIVLYAPTFRDSGGGPFLDGAIDPSQLETAARKHNLLFVIKQHAYAEKAHLPSSNESIVFYNSQKDSGELLWETDILVTDYSSIFFDYLLLDRPVVFFPYDRAKYFERDRQLLFNYDDFTPGPKCSSFSQLIQTVETELSSPSESWKEERKALREKAFLHRDGDAHLRLEKAIRALHSGSGHFAKLRSPHRDPRASHLSDANRAR